MTGAVALKITPAAEAAEVFKFQSAGLTVGKHNRQIKIDQVAVIGGVALGLADAVGIVTGLTGGVLTFDMLFVILEALIVQNAVAAVAFIAQGVIKRAFSCVIQGFIVLRKQGFKD